MYERPPVDMGSTMGYSESQGNGWNRVLRADYIVYYPLYAC